MQKRHIKFKSMPARCKVLIDGRPWHDNSDEAFLLFTKLIQYLPPDKRLALQVDCSGAGSELNHPHYLKFVLYEKNQNQNFIIRV